MFFLCMHSEAWIVSVHNVSSNTFLESTIVFPTFVTVTGTYMQLLSWDDLSFFMSNSMECCFSQLSSKTYKTWPDVEVICFG